MVEQCELNWGEHLDSLTNTRENTKKRVKCWCRRFFPTTISDTSRHTDSSSKKSNRTMISPLFHRKIRQETYINIHLRNWCWRLLGFFSFFSLIRLFSLHIICESGGRWKASPLPGPSLPLSQRMFWRSGMSDFSVNPNPRPDVPPPRSWRLPCLAC